VRAPGGFSVLLAGSGMVEYSRLTPNVRDDFLRIITGLLPHYDIVILDTGAGISDVVLFAVSLASEVLVVATPEPTSLTDAYATIKVLVGEQKTPLDPGGDQSGCTHGRRARHHGATATGAGPLCGRPVRRQGASAAPGRHPGRRVGAASCHAPPVAHPVHARLSGSAGHVATGRQN